MSVHAATNHLGWRVRLGYTWRDSTGGVYPKYEGYGCVLRPRHVLTSARVARAALRRTSDMRQAESFAEAGPHRRGFRQFWCDEKLDLAVLQTDEDMVDAAGRPLAAFPEFAGEPPQPGQAMGLLTEQDLTGAHFFPWGNPRQAKYVAYAYGCVSLLKSGRELLYALAGVMAGDHCLGTAVFDAEGRIAGVAVDYLNRYSTREETAALRASSAGYLVFSPTATPRKRADFLALLEGG